MLMDILTNYVAKKQKVWKHNRTLTVGASEIGLCARRTFYLKTAERQDKDHLARWGATHRGDLIEEHLVVPALTQRFNKNLLYAGKKQRTFVHKSLSATPDGLLINVNRNVLRHLGIKDIGSDCLLVEIKSIDPRANLEKEKHQHRLQAITQCGLVRLTTKYKPNYVLVIYVDASFHDEVKEFAVKFDLKTFTTLQARAETILKAKHAKELPPEGWIAGGAECEYCAWKDACGIERHALPSEKFKGERVDPQRVAEMTDLARQYLKLKQNLESQEAAVREQSERIKERLREWEIRKVPGVVTLSEVKGRTSLNMDALKEAAEKEGFDLTAFERIGEPTTRLTVSLPSDN